MTPEELLEENRRRREARRTPRSAAHSSGGDATAAGRQLLRTRALQDFSFWAEHFVKIKCKGGGDDIPFRLNAPQRRLVATFERARRSGRPIRVILLKARQWGASTCTQLYMAWLQLVQRKGLNSLIIAHQSAATDEIKDMFDRMLEAYPLWMLHDEDEDFPPKEKKMAAVGRSGSNFRVPQRNCKVKLGTAERPDSCRGGDYNLVHLSEVGMWRKTDGKRPEDIVRSACSGVMLASDTMIVLESTANGTGNFFHREYLAARAGESQFEAVFVPWYEIEQYELAPADPLESARQLLARRGEEHCSGRRQPGAYMWRLWEAGATLEALEWYQSERRKYSEHAEMASEFPSNEVEAFAHSGFRVFDPMQVDRLRQECREPLRTGVLSGEADHGDGALRSLRFIDEAEGALKVWEMPCGGWRDRYLTVVDVGGRSRKADWSVICVIDRGTSLDAKPRIVAQWRGHTDTDLLAIAAAQVAQFYCRSLLVIESNSIETRDNDREVDGDQTPYMFRLLRDIYPELYMRPAPPDMARDTTGARYGFHTNVATKPMVIASLVRVVREGLYVESDAGCCDEFDQYERKQNGSFGAVAGCHDDMLMTRAIGLYIAFNEMEAPRRIAARASGGACRASTFWRRGSGTEAQF